MGGESHKKVYENNKPNIVPCSRCHPSGSPCWVKPATDMSSGIKMFDDLGPVLVALL